MNQITCQNCNKITEVITKEDVYDSVSPIYWKSIEEVREEMVFDIGHRSMYKIIKELESAGKVEGKYVSGEYVVRRKNC